MNAPGVPRADRENQGLVVIKHLLHLRPKFLNLINPSMLNQYETVFIMTPVLSEEQMMDTVGKFKKILTDNGAEIVHENNWGLRKLAYPIQKKNTGFYYLVEYKSPGELINKLELEFKRDERIIDRKSVV